MPPASGVCIEPFTPDALSAAKDAIRRLFDLGLIDEDSATLALLAVAIGARRVRDEPPLQESRRDGSANYC
jgi:hypothetical protein